MLLCCSHACMSCRSASLAGALELTWKADGASPSLIVELVDESLEGCAVLPYAPGAKVLLP